MSPRPASLSALMAAAAALSQVAQAETATSTTTQYHYSNYDEDRQGRELVEGDARRYRVEAHQVRVVTPIDAHAQLDVSATAEVMSGSSPWYVVPDGQGGFLQAMSGATIHDERRELAVTLRREDEAKNAVDYSASFSAEDDYHSVSVGLGRERALTSQVTWAWGLSAAHDQIDPTDATIYDRIDHASKRSLSASTSWSFVLDRASLLQTGVQLNYADGYLSDPYKRVLVGETLARDARPGQRAQASLVARYRRHFDGLDGSLHLDASHGLDSWSIDAITLDAAWYQHLPGDWWLVPGVRYYTQGEASFYAPVADASTRDGAHSSDFRLGAFAAWEGRLSLRKIFGEHAFSVGVERYVSDDGGLGGGQDVPALVNFTRVFVGVDFGF